MLSLSNIAEYCMIQICTQQLQPSEYLWRLMATWSWSTRSLLRMKSIEISATMRSALSNRIMTAAGSAESPLTSTWHPVRMRCGCKCLHSQIPNCVWPFHSHSHPILPPNLSLNCLIQPSHPTIWPNPLTQSSHLTLSANPLTQSSHPTLSPLHLFLPIFSS